MWLKMRAFCLVAMSFCMATGIMAQSGGNSDGNFNGSVELQTLKSANPEMRLNDGRLRIYKTTGDQLKGTCVGTFEVTLSTSHGTSVNIPCANDAWHLHQPAGHPIVEISQIAPDGSILVRRTEVKSLKHQRLIETEIRDLNKIIPQLQPGDWVRVQPGTMRDAEIKIPPGIGKKDEAPITIDGAGLAQFTGNSRFLIEGANITLRKFQFTDVEDETITVTGPNFRLSGSKFTHCGTAQKPQSQCILLTSGATSAEIDFNVFFQSESMTIKIREDEKNGDNQPVGANIHHNVFRDINRLSENGQEPIQIAGQNGGESLLSLRAQIDHNLFLRAEGDVEAISFKAPGNVARWNVFFDMDAAPNLRGAAKNSLIGNLLFRTRPIRISGSSNRIEGNLIVCPRQTFAILISEGSAHYPAAVNNVISNNRIVARSGIKFAAQETPVTKNASGNRIEANEFTLEPRGAAFDGLAEAGRWMATNTIRRQTQPLCRNLHERAVKE
jgi:Chondroitinase B